jgi:hypothetical protein
MRFPRPRPDPQPVWTAEERAILRGEQDPPPPATLETTAWELATRYPALTLEQCLAAVRLAAEVLEQQHAGRPTPPAMTTNYHVLTRGSGYDHLAALLGSDTRTACGRTLAPAETTAVSLLVTGVTCAMCRRTVLYRRAAAAGQLDP